MAQSGTTEQQHSEASPAGEQWATVQRLDRLATKGELAAPLAHRDESRSHPRLTLKYLHGMIQSLQQEQQNMSTRMDELVNWLETAPWNNEHPSRTVQPKSQPKDALLLELQEAARIAEEIAAHAAAQEVAVHDMQPGKQNLPLQPAHIAADELVSPAEQLPSRQNAPNAKDGQAIPAEQPEKPASVRQEPTMIFIPRSERHRKPLKRPLWAKLFGR
jgi:hypothetical protein